MNSAQISPPTLTTRYLGRKSYHATWNAMRALTDRRSATSQSELWMLEHPPVFTQGQAGKAEHVLDAGDIPVVQTDRGGQVTYHGPGQLVAYLMINLRETHIGVRHLVTAIEQSIVDLLAALSVTASARADAPGVYVDGRKIAALGLRVRHGCTYHGFALNVDMDLSPFARINPCGYVGLEVTQLRDLHIELSVRDASIALLPHLCHHLKMRCVPGASEIPN